MNNTDNLFCVILAGGKGKRLWPSSRTSFPKQFIDFFGTGRTQLQQTYERLSKLVPNSHIFISTHKDYVDLVKEQLPDVSYEQILDEPIRRNTAPAVLWAVHHIQKNNPNAVVIVSPSDQDVHNEDAFAKNINEALAFMENNSCIITMGVPPSRPEPGYGYIQTGDYVGHDVYRVKSSTEKPNREFAQLFVNSGEFYWNTGIFLGTASKLLECLYKLLPTVLRELDKQQPNHCLQDERDFLETHFSAYPNMPIDRTLLEKAEDMFVLKCDFGWADLGTWHSIYETCQQETNDNVIVDSEAILENCQNCIVKMPNGKLAVINGLDGFIVVEKDNVLLICKKEDSSALIRKYVTEVQVKKGDDFI